MNKNSKRLTIIILLVLLLMACAMPQISIDNGQANPPTTVPQQDGTGAALQGTISALQTQVAGLTATAAAPAATTSATPFPNPGSITPLPTQTSQVSSTPLPTATTFIVPTVDTPTGTATQTATSSLACNRADFVADVTIPDYTHFANGAVFTKIWRLRNAGSCTWTTDYTIAFDHGYSMGKTLSVNLPNPVTPGATVDISVSLTAPDGNGIFQGYWTLKDPGGTRFGIGSDALQAFWVKIGAGIIDTQTPAANGSCDQVSMSPGINSTFSPNSDFDMRWTVKNTSGSTWTRAADDYKFMSGTKMYKNADIYDLPVDVASGSSVDIILDAIAPSTTGYYSTTWAIVQGSTVLCYLTNSIYVK